MEKSMTALAKPGHLSTKLPGKILERRPGRLHDHNAVTRLTRPIAVALHRRYQARANQRRFTAPRDADDCDQAASSEAADKLGDLLVASEKQVRFVNVERTQAGIGVLEFLNAFEKRGETHGRLPWFRRIGLKNVSRRAGSKGPYCSPT